MSVVLALAMVVLSLSVVLSFVRLLRGPSIPDRVLALDLMTMLGIGIIAVYAIATEQAVVIDVAVIIALLSFLGMIAFAYYIERRIG
mgnify:CR=1 FL=1